MLSLTLMTLFATTHAADIGTSELTSDWKLIESTVEKIMLPIKDYTLEVKSFRPDIRSPDPLYGGFDQRTSMILELHQGGWNNRVGRCVWNTIKHDSGGDVLVEECDVQYTAYRSVPADGKREQIWAWNVNSEEIELSCDGELQYSQLFAEGDASLRKPGLPTRCHALGTAPVDRIILKFMKGFYVRAMPKVGELKFPVYPICDCWRPECGHCSSPACTVEHDFSSSHQGLLVTSKLRWRKFNNLVLYDEAGNTIGRFHWSRSRVILTGGCIQCFAPVAVRRLKGMTTWSFSLRDGFVRIEVEGALVFEWKLRGQCMRRYGSVRKFAFYGMDCENTFRLTDEMVAGNKILNDCAETCRI